MKEKARHSIGINFDDALKAEVERVADIYKMPPSTFVRALAEMFIEAFNANQGKIIWPPQFLIHAGPIGSGSASWSTTEPGTQVKPNANPVVSRTGGNTNTRRT